MRKKMMKKVTAVLTSVVLAIGLMGCGSQNSGNNTQQARQEREDVTPESTQEPSAPLEQETENQTDAAQTEQETAVQTEQQPENDVDTSAENTDQPSAEGGKTLVVYSGGHRIRLFCRDSATSGVFSSCTLHICHRVK